MTQSSRDTVGERLATMMIDFNSLMKIDLIYDQKQVNELLRHLPVELSHATTVSGESDALKEISLHSEDISRYSTVLKRLEGMHHSLKDSSMVITLATEHSTLNERPALKSSQLKSSQPNGLMMLVEKHD